jgi:5-(carboxyamino)imidazole ribonucleotide mutase
LATKSNNKQSNNKQNNKTQHIMKVAVVMGSTSDWDVMKAACETLAELGIEYEKRVISAHRTPDLMFEFAKSARERGFGAIIAGAGGAAHVAGVTAAMTTVPVIGVPIKTSALGGLDSLLSIVQMPGGIPVSTTAINGAKNAALIAASIFALTDKTIEEKLLAFRKKQTEVVLSATLPEL